MLSGQLRSLHSHAQYSRSVRVSRPLAPVLMVQGTASHVGKTTLVAALCRWFSDRGVAVAPFKAQNMSLNAGVTPDGHEIGRAQLLQAAAARIRPCAQMNPILLKPQHGGAAQVVVLGRAEHVRAARDYQAQHARLWPVVAEALDTLRAEVELVIAEGAGSPAEINLHDRDLANMRVARHAGAAVLLVGDIERGGVFAALHGTVALLPPEEQALVRGFVINKFHGDASLVEPGPALLEARTGIPTLGTVPFYRDLRLPEEDLLAVPAAPPGPAALEIVVIRWPHLANFDDFDPLRHRPGVHLRFITAPAELGAPALLVLPGSKSTIADLAWLHATGLADAVRAHHATGRPVLGICGGFQMLGLRIEDPDGVEAAPGAVAGLGLLPHVTRFAAPKITRPVRGVIGDGAGVFAAAAGARVQGFELHMGRAGAPVRPFLQLHGAAGPVPEGEVSEDGRVAGTHLHGLFSTPAACEALLAAVAGHAGATLPPAAPERTLDAALDRLTAHVAAHVALPRVAEWVAR